jgi:hypothetical protein
LTAEAVKNRPSILDKLEGGYHGIGHDRAVRRAVDLSG